MKTQRRKGRENSEKCDSCFVEYKKSLLHVYNGFTNKDRKNIEASELAKTHPEVHQKMMLQMRMFEHRRIIERHQRNVFLHLIPDDGSGKQTKQDLKFFEAIIEADLKGTKRRATLEESQNEIDLCTRRLKGYAVIEAPLKFNWKRA